MNKDLHFSSKSENWQTPKYFFDYWHKRYNFVLDAAASKENHLCPLYFDKNDNALELSWNIHLDDRTCHVWCNPPYGKQVKDFVHKAYIEARDNNAFTIMLLPARVDTKWWQEHINLAYLIKGRIAFVDPIANTNNSAPFPSAVALFHPLTVPRTQGFQPTLKYLDLKTIKKDNTL